MSINNLHGDGKAKDPAVEQVIKRLEDVCERISKDESISVMRQDQTSTVYIPMRIREIVQDCLSPVKWEGPVAADAALQEENQLLKQELERARVLLRKSQNDCEELSCQYLAVSEKIEQAVQLEQSLMEVQRENQRLRQELGDLRAEQDRHPLGRGTNGLEERSEQVQRLEAMVQQYQERCGVLQARVKGLEGASLAGGGQGQLQARVRELEEKLVSVARERQEEAELWHAELRASVEETEEQQQRSLKLAVSNSRLRQQLDDTRNTSSRLMDDVNQLTASLNDTREKLKISEAQWEQSFEDECGRSLRAHQLSLSVALRETSAVKTDFGHLRSSLERELGVAQSEFGLLCDQLLCRVREADGVSGQTRGRMAIALQQKERDCGQVSAELASLRVEHETLQARLRLSVEDLERRVEERRCALHEAEHICQERAKVIEDLENSNTALETGQTALTGTLRDKEQTISQLEGEIELLKSGMDAIVQIFTSGGDISKVFGTREVPESNGKTEFWGDHVTGRVGHVTAMAGFQSPRKEGTESRARSTNPFLPSNQQEWLSSTAFGTAGDVNRLKDWAVSVVRHGVDSKDESIRALRQELEGMREVCREQEDRLKETEGEMKAHTLTSSVVQSDLDTCRVNLQELTKARVQLEQQLEETTTQKVELERQLGQSVARMEALLEEKRKMEAANCSLQEAIRSIRYELEKTQQAKDGHERELASRQSSIMRLEMQLRGVEEESNGLRARTSELESDKQSLEREISEHKLSVSTLEMEKERLQKELRDIHATEVSASEALNRLRQTNSELEKEKRQLTRSLQEGTEVRARLDRENVELERIRVANEEELERLRKANSRLSEQVDHFDKSLGEADVTRQSVQTERDRFKQEVAILREALGKTKQALAEVQIQRGKLNNAVAKMAQEKGDLIREKVSLASELTKAREDIRNSEERLSLLTDMKARLEEKAQGLEKQLALAELNQSSLEETNFVLQQEKHNLSVKTDRLGKRKDDEINRMQSEKDLELHQSLLQAKAREAELQSEIERVMGAGSEQARKLEAAHSLEIASLTEHHQETVVRLKEEIDAVGRVRMAEAASLRREKEAANSHAEEEKVLLAERASKLQKLLDERCVESHHQQLHAGHMVAEQKAQIDTSQLNAKRLESELSTAERQLESLRTKLENVGSETSIQVDCLSRQLREASQTISQLEKSQDDAKLSIKRLEARGENLRRQSNELQQHLQNALRESSKLRVECQELRSSLSSAQRELSQSKQAMALLEGRLVKSEEVRSLAEADISSTRQSLTKVEQTHSSLVSEHITLQAAMTAIVKDKTSLQLELKAALKRASQLEKEKEDLSRGLAAAEDRLNVLDKTCALREQEITNYRQQATNLERERIELSSSLGKLQEDARMQGEVDTAEQSKLQCVVSELKSSKAALQDQVSSLETKSSSLEEQCSSLQLRVATADRQVATLASQLKRNESLRQDIQTKHTQLLGMLEGTLGLQPANGSETPGVQATELASPSLTRAFSPRKVKDKSLDSSDHLSHSLAESGVGASIASPSVSLHSSIGGAQQTLDAARRPASPMEVCHLDAELVRQAILNMQSKLKTAERLKHEALSSAQVMKRSIQKLEDERSSLQSRLQTFRSSLSSLQGSFDSVVRERDDVEGVVKAQKGVIRDQERKEQELKQQIANLQERLGAESAVKQASDTQLKKYAKAQTVFEVERNQLQSRVEELEVQKVSLEEEAAKLQKEISFLQSSHATNDADFEQLQQKLATSQRLHNEMGEQVRLLKERLRCLDQSFRISQETEKKLLAKIQQLETDLMDAKANKHQEERRVSELARSLELVQKDKAMSEERVRRLTLNQLENDSEKEQLKEKVKELDKSLSEGEVTKTELSTHLQSVEMQLQEQEGGAQRLEVQLLELSREKEAITARLKSLESSLQSSSQDKKATQERCIGLEKEINRLRGELQKSRECNAQLQNDLREAQFQAERLDVLVSSQQKQKADLDQSLVSSSKENVELIRSVREMRATLDEKERAHQATVAEMRDRMERDQATHKLTNAQWKGKEQSYRKTIHHLETKAHLLEEKLQQNKQRKARYIERAREQEEAIHGLRSLLGDSVHQLASGGLEEPSSIDHETSKLNQSAMDIMEPRRSSSWIPSGRYSPARSPTGNEGDSFIRSLQIPAYYSGPPCTSTPSKEGGRYQT